MLHICTYMLHICKVVEYMPHVCDIYVDLVRVRGYWSCTFNKLAVRALSNLKQSAAPWVFNMIKHSSACLWNMTSMTWTFYNLNKSPLLQFTKHKLPDPHLLPNYYAMPFMQTLWKKWNIENHNICRFQQLDSLYNYRQLKMSYINYFSKG